MAIKTEIKGFFPVQTAKKNMVFRILTGISVHLHQRVRQNMVETKIPSQTKAMVQLCSVSMCNMASVCVSVAGSLLSFSVNYAVVVS